MRLCNKIQLELMTWCRGNPYDIIIPNFYYGRFEMDVFRLLPSGYCVEYEIKISKADFKKDFKKGFATGGYTRPLEQHTKHDRLQGGQTKTNRFFFVVPADLVQVSDCPKHAGLIYYHEGRFSVLKSAPLLHKNQASPEVYKELSKSLSFREQKLRSDLRWMKYKQQDHVNLISRLKDELRQLDPKNLTLFVEP